MSFAKTAGEPRSARAADHRRRLSAAVLVTLLLAATIPAAAAAQDFSPGDPALDEYVESLPVAEGNRPPGSSSHRAPLPAATRRALADSSGGARLVRLAESPALGAPAKQARGKRGEHSRPASGGQADGRTPSAHSDGGSLVSATADTFGGGAGLIVLLLLLSVIAAALLGRRRNRSG